MSDVSLHELLHHASGIDALLDVVDALTLESDFESFFTRAANAARDVVDGDGVAIVALREDGDLEYRFFHGVQQLLGGFTGFRFSLDTGTVGRALSQRRTLFEPDYPRSEEALQPFIEVGLRANLILPMFNGDQPVGALAISWFREPPEAIEPARVTLADKIAQQIAVVFQRHLLEQRLRHQALSDGLTGLCNRAGIMQRLEQRLASRERHGGRFAVILLDMNDLKTVNDAFGHTFADALLRDCGSRLREMCRRDDDVGRIGGDEFLIVADCEAQWDTPLPLLQRLLAAMSIALEPHRGKWPLASIGVAMFPDDGTDLETLLHRADVAMYAVKAAGKGDYCLYDPALEARVRYAERTAREVLAAIGRDELALYYQPICHLAASESGRAVEALVRWHKPGHEVLTAGEFVPEVEAAGLGLIQELDRWVLKTAVSQLDAWWHQGRGPDCIHVNISGTYFVSKDFITELRGVLARCASMPSDALVIEVTETTVMANTAAVGETVNACRDLGVLVALDDLGTGYASLTHLKILPVDMVKVDAAFVLDLFDSQSSWAIVTGIFAMTRAMGLKAVAEGVETRYHQTPLRALGCDWFQGFGVAEPMDGAALLSWLEAGRGGQ